MRSTEIPQMPSTGEHILLKSKLRESHAGLLKEAEFTQPFDSMHIRQVVQGS